MPLIGMNPLRYRRPEYNAAGAVLSIGDPIPPSTVAREPARQWRNNRVPADGGSVDRKSRVLVISGCGLRLDLNAFASSLVVDHGDFAIASCIKIQNLYSVRILA